MQTKKDVLEKTTTCRSAVLRDREASQLEASSSSGLCCSNDNMQQISGDRTSRCSGLNLDQLVKARNMGILKLSPADEVEGELIQSTKTSLQCCCEKIHKWSLLSLVAVHLDCYRSVKSTTGPWHCELCEDLVSSRGSGALATNSWEKPYFVAECGLCGGTAGAFRKSVDGQWIHALCAEDGVGKGVDACTVCRRKHGVCLKCNYGHCQTTFHPTCARSAGFYMTVRTTGGKLQHKAYCEKHSIEQRAKADTQKHGIDEFKSLKQVRVELERLRLLCERIIKREKLKRELVICSHNILASNRDSVLSALARHPFYQPEVSSESATTSIKGYTDSYKSGSTMVQRSDDVTVDSTVAGKRRVKLPMSLDNDRKTDDSSTSQNLYTLKPMERVSFSGKQIPQRVSAASRNLSDDVETRSKYRKVSDTVG
ncbi:hypothetical protein DH2020_033880 [Rehmannia glutinosa]|uniref:PHD-type domain-containing protein n=1 Tax=Rehmannia glutinosa TaxID=99300 RepID=A0ABR0VE78_REHGL